MKIKMFLPIVPVSLTVNWGKAIRNQDNVTATLYDEGYVEKKGILLYEPIRFVCEAYPEWTIRCSMERNSDFFDEWSLVKHLKNEIINEATR